MLCFLGKFRLGYSGHYKNTGTLAHVPPKQHPVYQRSCALLRWVVPSMNSPLAFSHLPPHCSQSKPQSSTQVPSRPGCSSAREAAAGLPSPTPSGAAESASQRAGLLWRRRPTAPGCSRTQQVGRALSPQIHTERQKDLG